MDERIGATQQECLLALMCHDDENGRVVSRMVTPAEFEGDYRLIAERAVDYWSKHDCAPAVHVPDILSDVLEDPKNPRAKTYKQVITGLLDIAPGVNAKYVLDRLYAFKRGQQLKAAILTTAQKLASKSEFAIGEVEEYLHQVLRHQPVQFDSGRSLEDHNFVLRYLEHNFNEFTTGIEQLDKAQVVPYRGALMILIAVKGHGKSWWLVHLGAQAWHQRKKVVHLTLEMSEEEVMMRYYQTLFSVTNREAVDEADKDDLRIEKFVLEKVKKRKDKLIGFEKEWVKPEFSFNSRLVREELESRLVQASSRARNFRIKRFPPQTLTPDMIRGYLDNLELTERFIPDMLIVDYAGLMKTDPKNQRIDIGRNVMELRAIGVERNIAVCTVHQSTRLGAKAKSVKAVHASEDWTIVQTADQILTFSATEAEKERGLGRLWVEHSRSRKDHWGLVLSQSLVMGQFAVYSTWFHETDYWALVPSIDDAGAEEPTEDEDEDSE